jgi:hypothetical protein
MRCFSLGVNEHQSRRIELVQRIWHCCRQTSSRSMQLLPLIQKRLHLPVLFTITDQYNICRESFGTDLNRYNSHTAATYPSVLFR